MPSELRPYQFRALAQTRSAYRAGKRAICVVMPTGAGKTRLGAEFVKGHLARGGRCLWLAHRQELVAQAAERLMAEGLREVGVVASSHPNPAPLAAVQVGSTQTLCCRDALPEASLVVLDEAHHYVAAQWGQLAAKYAGAIRLGLTATPERSDGKPLGELFDSIVVGSTPRELTGLGFLVPCDVLAPSRYRPGLIAGDPVRTYLEHASGRRAFVFAATVEHARELAADFSKAGVPATFVSAATSDEERAAAIEGFRRGDVLALCNVGIFTEGTDVPEAEVCLLARGCSSAGTYLQMVGRVLRPAPGKQRALLLDLPGVSRKYGLPNDDREYSLRGKRGIVWDRSGHAGKGGARRPRQIAAALTRVSVDTPDYERKREFLREMYKQAEARGYRSGWAIHRFRQQFGHLPWGRPGVAA